mmetsp:Transcript_9116/g.16450  ORF Transcript_9116/g.16450 Transcript_9116/m.16450 type:complete len:208 (+) Transcript_9116:230-853(+)
MASSFGLSSTVLSDDSRTLAASSISWWLLSPELIGASSTLPSGVCTASSGAAFRVSTSPAAGLRAPGGAPQADGRAEAAVGDERGTGVAPPAAFGVATGAGLAAGPGIAFTVTPQDRSSFTISASSVAGGGLVCLFCAVIANRWTTGTFTLVLPAEQHRQGPHASLFSAVHISTDASRRSISTSSCGLLMLLYSIRTQHGVNRRVLF